MTRLAPSPPSRLRSVSAIRNLLRGLSAATRHWTAPPRGERSPPGGDSITRDVVTPPWTLNVTILINNIFF